MNTIFSNWNVMRVIRLVLSLAIIVQSVMQRDIFWGIAGAFFLFTAIANVGCCGAGACTVEPKKTKEKEVSYEEVV